MWDFPKKWLGLVVIIGIVIFLFSGKRTSIQNNHSLQWMFKRKMWRKKQTESIGYKGTEENNYN